MRLDMDSNVEQILKVSKEISMSSKRGKPNFIWTTEDTFKHIQEYIQECAEREENKKRCTEIEENLNRSIKNDTK